MDRIFLKFNSLSKKLLEHNILSITYCSINQFTIPYEDKIKTYKKKIIGIIVATEWNWWLILILITDLMNKFLKAIYFVEKNYPRKEETGIKEFILHSQENKS